MAWVSRTCTRAHARERTHTQLLKRCARAIFYLSGGIMNARRVASKQHGATLCCGVETVSCHLKYIVDRSRCSMERVFGTFQTFKPILSVKQKKVRISLQLSQLLHFTFGCCCFFTSNVHESPHSTPLLYIFYAFYIGNISYASNKKAYMEFLEPYSSLTFQHCISQTS